MTTPTRSRRRLYAAAALAGAGAMIPALYTVPAGAADTETQAFSYTGEPETWTVPADVYCVDVVAIGAAGGTGGDYSDFLGAPGGSGGQVSATLVVSPGAVLDIFVGQRGGDGNGDIPAEINGAGPAAVYTPQAGNAGDGGLDTGGPGGEGLGAGGGGGGGASYIGLGGGVLVIAGGGGGGGAGGPAGDGGTGGSGGMAGSSGADGVPFIDEGEGGSYGTGGGGATQGAAGAAGTLIASAGPSGATLPTDGNGTLGGDGGSDGDGGGGGGGGWFGGGGGYPGYGASGAGGGGGSSFGPAGSTYASDVITPDGNGAIDASWIPGDRSCTPDPQPAVQAVAVEPSFTG